MNEPALCPVVQSQLKAHRLRVTISRAEVFDALHRCAGQALSREALLERIAELGGNADRPTMNRALRDLNRAGLVMVDDQEGASSMFRLKGLSRVADTRNV